MYGLVQSGAALWQYDVNAQPLTMPFQVPGTTLVVHNLLRYEGEYLEDEGVTFERDLAAVCLENVGSSGVECARVILQWQDGSYVFDVDMLPKGTTVVVLEKYRQPYAEHPWIGCSAVQKTGDDTWLNTPLEITAQGLSGIVVTNPTDKMVTDVTLHFKNYLSENRLFVGGLAYQYKVGDLAPGASATVEPYHFMWGSSQIVRIGWNVGKEY